MAISNSPLPITTVLGSSPKDFDVALVSIANSGVPGDLNRSVLKELDYSYDVFKDLELNDGYYLLNGYSSLLPVLFIVTIDTLHGKQEPADLLNSNLDRALSAHFDLLVGKRIWVPLMATGAGRISLEESYEITTNILQLYPNLNFTISVYDNQRGRDFYENIISKRPPKPSDRDLFLNLVAEVLNKEFGLDFERRVSREDNILGNSYDLFDEQNTAYSKLFIEKPESTAPEETKGKDIGQDGKIMSDSITDITAAMDILDPELQAIRYYAIFGQQFSNDEVEEIKDRFTSNMVDYNPYIYTVDDIIELAEKHGIEWESRVTGIFAEPSEDNKKDRISFLIDNVEDTDHLSRKPLARSFVRLVNNDVFENEKLKHSFTVHVDGEWGAGKSTFLNLIESELYETNRDWIVMKYNAWQNQHIDPPWWTLIDQIYKQGMRRVFGGEVIALYLKEKWRRIVWYSGWNKILSFVFFVIFTLILIFYGESIFDAISNFEEGTDDQTKGVFLEVFAKLIVSVGSVVGVIYSLSKFVSTPFTIQSAEDAKSFLRRAADPMNRIKRHFSGLIGNLNGMNYEIAIFIDDIDRCDPEAVVSLLEGIQTLFKDKKVLYIVAGDKNWITTCFRDKYKLFKDNVNQNGEDLGNLFLEKTFQLSLRIPNISTTVKERYWKENILQLSPEEKPKKTFNESNRKTAKRSVKKQYMSGDSETTNIVAKVQETYGTSYEEAADLVIEALDENTEEVTHLLAEYHAFIDSNPRSIKRLANRYMFSRNTLVAENKNFNRERLFRWLIIEDIYPSVIETYLEKEKILSSKEIIAEDILRNSSEVEALIELVEDPKLEHGGPLRFQELIDILGY